MAVTLAETLETLRAHEPELRKQGVRHVAVFGSLARREASPESDIDVLVDLDPEKSIGVFEYAGLKLFIGDLLGERADVANRRALKPMVRDGILRDAVQAF